MSDRTMLVLAIFICFGVVFVGVGATFGWLLGAAAVAALWLMMPQLKL